MVQCDDYHRSPRSREIAAIEEPPLAVGTVMGVTGYGGLVTPITMRDGIVSYDMGR